MQPGSAPRIVSTPTSCRTPQSRGAASRHTSVFRRVLVATSGDQDRRTEWRTSLRLQGADSIQTTPESVQQAKTPKRHREEDEVSPPLPSLEPFPKRVRTSPASARKPVRWKTVREARVDYWNDKGTWPTEEQEATMHRFRDLLDNARARKRSLSRKRSNPSLNSETSQTQTSSNQQPRDQKSAPYKHQLFEEQLKDCGSFMDDCAEGITDESEKLCETLLVEPQLLPQHTLFSEDDLFKKTCKRMRGENEAKVVRDIAPLIVPSAEILADSGAQHLEIVRETVNACWVNSITFIKPIGSRPGPRPQPDVGLGFKRDAFSREQLQKLQPLTGNLLTDSTFIAATYNMYLPFFSVEVKCGAAALDIADRQNAHTQSVILRGLHTLFRLVGREKELHREINGFSISHSDVDVRIWGHYAVIDRDDVKYYRHPIRKFDFTELNGKERWTAYTFVKNVYDLWLPKHFKRICDIIDTLPADVNFDVSEQDPELVSSRSGLSQQFEGYRVDDERVIPDSQPVTPDTTIGTESAHSKKKRTLK
ncbi:hypothetical protein P154DRAFT_549923 [Amniculicola lignicola CBS 123094]|uniref:DUF7924 domain-containing protein n=1 Tax=Amniculicola lignicola CBS 123094 TaxID=1392246 RepID=A0A6A5VVM7_9PLEO|nr:hypothetical protein P154DRAFT_549923 [Amniculicola lignicola CBS 123094]